MIAAGRLRQFGEFQRPVPVKDSGGGAVVTWPVFCAAHVRIVALSGRELYEAQQLMPSVTHRMETRFIEGLNETMRFVYNGRLFAINNVLNVEERGFEMHVLCTEQKPANT